MIIIFPNNYDTDTLGIEIRKWKPEDMSISLIGNGKHKSGYKINSSVLAGRICLTLKNSSQSRFSG